MRISRVHINRTTYNSYTVRGLEQNFRINIIQKRDNRFYPPHIVIFIFKSAYMFFLLYCQFSATKRAELDCTILLWGQSSKALLLAPNPPTPMSSVRVRPGIPVSIARHVFLDIGEKSQAKVVSAVVFHVAATVIPTHATKIQVTQEANT